ncbi:MAG: nucleotidyltransferase family protein [bacterium]
MLCPKSARIIVSAERSSLLAHLRKTRFSDAGRERALREARSVADYLKRTYGARVIGIGSAFARDRTFRSDSDIDLVVEGIPAEQFFAASARAADLTSFSLDLIPLESSTPRLRETMDTEGVPL